MCHMTLHPHNTCLTVLALAEAAMKLDWISFETIDVPRCQRPLSGCLHEAPYHHLIDSASGFHSSALALSSALPLVRDCLNGILALYHLRSSTTGQRVEVMPLVLARVAYVGEGGPCPICQTPTDAYGDHHVSCGGKGTEYTCTTQIGNILFFVVQSAAVAPWKQGPSPVDTQFQRSSC